MATNFRISLLLGAYAILMHGPWRQMRCIYLCICVFYVLSVSFLSFVSHMLYKLYMCWDVCVCSYLRSSMHQNAHSQTDEHEPEKKKVVRKCKRKEQRSEKIVFLSRFSINFVSSISVFRHFFPSSRSLLFSSVFAVNYVHGSNRNYTKSGESEWERARNAMAGRKKRARETMSQTQMHW